MDFIESIISAVIGGVILLIVEYFLFSKSDKGIEGKNTIIIIEPSEKVKQNKTNKRESKKNDTDSDVIGWLFLAFLLLLVGGYIKYRNLVHSVIIMISIAVGIMAVGVAFFCRRKNMKFRKDLNGLLVFNIFALILVPYLILQTIEASKAQGIDMEFLKQKLDKGETYIGNDIFDTIFLIYQIIGLISILFYMLFVLVSNIYLIALVNVNLDNGKIKIWKFLLRNTYKLVSNPKTIVCIEIIFLILSYLMVSGVIWNLVTR